MGDASVVQVAVQTTGRQQSPFLGLVGVQAKCLSSVYLVHFNSKWIRGRAKLWHDSECIASLKIVKQYIQNQLGGAIHPHRIDDGEFRTFS
jgi:hypothetical protein